MSTVELPADWVRGELLRYEITGEECTFWPLRADERTAVRVALPRDEAQNFIGRWYAPQMQA